MDVFNHSSFFGIVSLGAYSLNSIKIGSNSAKSEQIIIASKDDSQFDIIANMYKILLEKIKSIMLFSVEEKMIVRF